MKINIAVYGSGIGLQMFDAWYAFKQSQSKYKTDIEVSITPERQSADLNILFSYNPSHLKTNEYDLVFFCNGGETLQVGTDYMQQHLEKDNCYLIANSYVTVDHQLHDKIVWFPHNIQTCRDFWTRHFYPQYFENAVNQNLNRTESIMIINGENRSWRNHVFSQLGNINTHSLLSRAVTTTNHAPWESTQDTEYREFVNEQYSLERPKDNYYTNAVDIGIDKKFGPANPGYFVMPEYYTHHCVVFPESTWQNNELAITEKALKCFYAGSIPFPVGGANINALYNKLGFSTAWNLLPKDMRAYDSNTHHASRVEQTVNAIRWLSLNSNVFHSTECNAMQQHNFAQFLNNQIEHDAILKLDRVLGNL
jgi:hypothetical protein